MHTIEQMSKVSSFYAYYASLDRWLNSHEPLCVCMCGVVYGSAAPTYICSYIVVLRQPSWEIVELFSSFLPLLSGRQGRWLHVL